MGIACPSDSSCFSSSTMCVTWLRADQVYTGSSAGCTTGMARSRSGGTVATTPAMTMMMPISLNMAGSGWCAWGRTGG
jgi:hypothetical protein